MEFEPVIGLEVHAQLMTKSKVFCGCPIEGEASANASICPVCTGQPGALPVLSAKAVELALKAGLALSCRLNSPSVFARKNYFYPDLPKGYQISQHERPLFVDGHLDIEDAGSPSRVKRVRIGRIHMEEDAGKSVHAAEYSLIDLNRAGTPLIEIVSQPDLRSSQEAGAYLRRLRAILMYLDVCDGGMQEGRFRCDANVSIRPKGSSALGTRAEIKNVNSFRFVEKAIEYEINRQIQLVQNGGTVVQETRTYDSGKNATLSMRAKEEAHDYRYFPDPDLVPLSIGETILNELRNSLPELPDQKKERFIKTLGLTPYDAAVLTSNKNLALFFEDTVAICGEPKLVANWVTGEMLRLLKSDDREWDDLTSNMPIKASGLGALIKMIKSGMISNTIGKTVFEEMFKAGRSPEEIVEEKGLVQISDVSAILPAIDAILAASEKQVEEYRSGKEKVLGFLVGQIMKKTNGKANPALVTELLKKKLSEGPSK